MVEIDTTPEPDMPPGLHFVEVKAAKFKFSKNGDPMFELTFGSVDLGGRKVCLDWILLGGGGKGIGLSKLKALGFSIPDKSKINIEPHELLGKRVYINTVASEWKDKFGNAKMQLSFSKLDDCPFYWAADNPPAGYQRPTSAQGGADDPWTVPPTGSTQAPADDIPF